MGKLLRTFALVSPMLMPGMAPAGSIPNWAAPSTWTPPAAGTTAKTGVKTGLVTLYPPLPFIPLTPCRLADTRSGSGFPGQWGPPSIAGGGTQRTFTITGQCGIPTGAQAVSFNFAVWGPPTRGDLRVFPAGGATPLVSTLNWEAGILALANAAVVPLGTGEAITVQVDGAGTVDVFFDVNGYYATDVTASSTQTFYLSSSAPYALRGVASMAGVMGQGGMYGVLGVSSTGGGAAVNGLGHSGAIGVVGDTSTSTGIGVYGIAQTNIGVRGDSTSGAGVYGVSSTNYGVYGQSSTNNGIRGVSSAAGLAALMGLSHGSGSGAHGVGGFADGTGVIFGVQGEVGTGASQLSAGVHGIGASSPQPIYGVLGESHSTSNVSAGVAGIAGSGKPIGYGNCCYDLGVLGMSAFGVGVGGTSQFSAGYFDLRNSSGTAIQSAYLAYNAGANQYAGYFSGNTATTGSKSFIEPHPQDPTRIIRYVSLEGPEAGTYFRGRGKFSGKVAVIPVPENFRIVSSEEGLTAHVTPIGHQAGVWVSRIDLNEIVVESTRDVEFSYIVHGVRRAYSSFTPVAEGMEFAPRSAEETIPAYLSEELRQRLVSNGTYNADGTVNLQTAERLGWVQKWREEEQLRQQAQKAQLAISHVPAASGPVQPQ